MGAVGGYVRRCERKPYHEPRSSYTPRFEMFYQSMPVLRFEQFDVRETVDKDDKPTITSIHERFQGHRTY